jgi:hypothetical protein
LREKKVIRTGVTSCWSYTWKRANKSRSAFEKLRQLLTEEDLKSIEKSSREFREKFKLR